MTITTGPRNNQEENNKKEDFFKKSSIVTLDQPTNQQKSVKNRKIVTYFFKTFADQKETNLADEYYIQRSTLERANSKKFCKSLTKKNTPNTRLDRLEDKGLINFEDLPETYDYKAKKPLTPKKVKVTKKYLKGRLEQFFNGRVQTYNFFKHVIEDESISNRAANTQLAIGVLDFKLAIDVFNGVTEVIIQMSKLIENLKMKFGSVVNLLKIYAKAFGVEIRISNKMVFIKPRKYYAAELRIVAKILKRANALKKSSTTLYQANIKTIITTSLDQGSDSIKATARTVKDLLISQKYLESKNQTEIFVKTEDSGSRSFLISEKPKSQKEIEINSKFSEAKKGKLYSENLQKKIQAYTEASEILTEREVQKNLPIKNEQHYYCLRHLLAKTIMARGRKYADDLIKYYFLNYAFDENNKLQKCNLFGILIKAERNHKLPNLIASGVKVSDYYQPNKYDYSKYKPFLKTEEKIINERGEVKEWGRLVKFREEKRLLKLELNKKIRNGESVEKEEILRNFTFQRENILKESIPLKKVLTKNLVKKENISSVQKIEVVLPPPPAPCEKMEPVKATEAELNDVFSKLFAIL